MFASESLQPLLTLILASTVVMGSPGPSTMSALAVSAAFGLRRSFIYVLGLMLGTGAVLLAVATGVVAMLLSLPALGRVLIYASAAYVLYLAWQIATAPPLGDQPADVPSPSFTPGFVLAVANPKAWFAIAAVFTAATLSAGSSALDAMLKVAVLALMIVVIHLAWVFAGASLSRFLRDPVISRIANVAFAVVLAATAVVPLLR
jgi:threonine/homoserine/homoserine lactone efflux protein